MARGNINAVQNKGKPICPMAVSIHMPTGYIDTVPRNRNPYAQWLSHYIRPLATLIQSLKL